MTLRNSAEVCHRWAQNNGGYGEAGNLRFDGPQLIFYQTTIGRFITHRGKAAVILNDTSYSSRTAKHRNNMYRAINYGEGMTCIHIGDLLRGTNLKITGREAFDYAMSQAALARAKSVRATTYKASHLEHSEMWMNRANEVAEFYGLKVRASEESIKKLQAAKEKAQVEHREAMKKAQAIREKRDKDKREILMKDLESWTNGGSVNSYQFRNLPVRLRVERTESWENCGEMEKIQKSEIVTSIGARIPYAAGKKTFLFYMKVREKGWRRNGDHFKIGEYQLDAANPDGIIAGCHRISHDEIMRFATQEGWI